jgi:transglycosylase-like protein with SLT domain
MKLPFRLAAPLLAVGLAACGSVTQAPVSSTATAPRQPGAVPVAEPTEAPTPRARVMDPAYIANELGQLEEAIRSSGLPETEYASLGQREQNAYHVLEAHPDWIPAVLDAVPTSVRPAIEANLTAAQQIGDLNGVSQALPHWKIIAPPAPDTLLSYYRESQQTYGVSWQYLAAINLIETNMGRIQGLSSAGAQGPMQFMPSTWAYYGRGDVNNPHDAILAAGRYLQAHGAPQDMTRAIYAYNPSMLYVRAVQLYAQEMFDNARTFLAYYNWQVYVPTPAGNTLLPVGFSN